MLGVEGALPAVGGEGRRAEMDGRDGHGEASIAILFPIVNARSDL
jgi:hypothetical protein